MASVPATFPAFRIHSDDAGYRGGIEPVSLDDLAPGEVVIKAAWSSVNYKDALAGTGKGKILRRFPLVGGIDVAGHVVASTDPKFREGDPVRVANARGSFEGVARVTDDVNPGIVVATLGYWRSLNRSDGSVNSISSDAWSGLAAHSLSPRTSSTTRTFGRPSPESLRRCRSRWGRLSAPGSLLRVLRVSTSSRPSFRSRRAASTATATPFPP